jgi:hypothetical protein
MIGMTILLVCLAVYLRKCTGQAEGLEACKL